MTVPQTCKRLPKPRAQVRFLPGAIYPLPTNAGGPRCGPPVRLVQPRRAPRARRGSVHYASSTVGCTLCLREITRKMDVTGAANPHSPLRRSAHRATGRSPPACRSPAVMRRPGRTGGPRHSARTNPALQTAAHDAVERSNVLRLAGALLRRRCRWRRPRERRGVLRFSCGERRRREGERGCRETIKAVSCLRVIFGSSFCERCGEIRPEDTLARAGKRGESARVRPR